MVMPPNIKCNRCGGEVPAGSRFCPYGGIGVPHRPTYLSQRVGMIALIATLGWVIGTVSLAEYKTGLLVLIVAFGAVLPTMILIAVALYVMYPRCSSISLRAQPINPVVMFLMTLAWLSVSLVLVSDPEEEGVMAALLGVGYTLALFLGWAVLLVASTQVVMAPGWSVIKRVAYVVGYLAPLPVAAWFFFYPVGEDFLALRARFELSESALERDVRERPTDNHRAGLFEVSKIEDVEACVFLETGGSVLEEGFAYCPYGQPRVASLGSPPIVLIYPMNGDWETSRWWSYDIQDRGAFEQAISEGP